jgi:hypothetical protein
VHWRVDGLARLNLRADFQNTDCLADVILCLSHLTDLRELCLSNVMSKTLPTLRSARSFPHAALTQIHMHMTAI